MHHRRGDLIPKRPNYAGGGAGSDAGIQTMGGSSTTSFPLLPPSSVLGKPKLTGFLQELGNSQGRIARPKMALLHGLVAQVRGLSAELD